MRRETSRKAIPVTSKSDSEEHNSSPARARAGEGQDAEGMRAPRSASSGLRGPTAPPYSRDPETPRAHDTRTPVHTLPRTAHPKTVRGTKIESGTPLPQELRHIRIPMQTHYPCKGSAYSRRRSCISNFSRRQADVALPLPVTKSKLQKKH